jgi:hypothetical protein
MDVTDHARDAALMRVLQLHRISLPNDRILVAELEGTWKAEIGLRRNDLLGAIDRMLVAGRLVHCATLSGAALQLTERGADELRRTLPMAGRSRLGRLADQLVNACRTFFTLRIARQRTLTRLRFVGSPAEPAAARRCPVESREALLARKPASQTPSWTPPPTAPGTTPSRVLPVGSARNSSRL